MAAAALFAAAACDDSSRQESLFNPEIGHPANWIADHGDAALRQGSTCPECHGSDLRGGASQVSCFISQFDGVSCHASGVGKRHTSGYALPEEHGKAAKARPGISSGFASCQACHGSRYEGGSSEISCRSCHMVDAPHPAAPWLDDLYTHEDVNEQNAGACTGCHRDIGSTEPPGCFNGSLCHGEKAVHPDGWDLPGLHGAEAKGDPAAEGGFQGCQDCHGADFTGGTSGVSCTSCHGIRAPHPVEGWSGGGPGHRSTDEGNAPVCADCHSELADPPDCFSANGCHGGGSAGGDSPPDEGSGDTTSTPEGGQNPPLTDTGGETTNPAQRLFRMTR